MTSNARGGGRILGSLGSAEGKGIVRIEDRLDTDIDDVWSALTDPSRLARWYGEVEGDLRLGGEYRAHLFASGWEGTGRVEACEPPQRLVVRIKDADEPDEGVIEVTLTVEGELTVGTPEGASPLWQEFGPSQFRRQIGLPAEVDAEQIQAAYRNGILLLTVPKAEHARPRQIKVQTA